MPYGAAGQTLKRLPEWVWDEEMRAAADYAYDNGIREVVPVVGALTVEKDGRTATTSGVIDKLTGKLYVRADSMQDSVSEIVEHEVGHYRTSERSAEAFMESVRSRYKPEAWQRVYEAYKRKYAELTNDYDGMSEREVELYVWEEILEDAYSEKDRFGTKASLYGAEADAALDGTEDIERPGLPELEGAEGGTQPEAGGIRGPPVRYSYWNTAGEIEARDAAARRTMTPEQRRATPPALGGEDAVFAVDENDDSSTADAQITRDDAAAIQGIERKSLNDLTSEELKSVETFARRYWAQMGTKSPFFRAWFGDWRAGDTTPVSVADQPGDARGRQHNEDTGWEINISGKVFNETRIHTRPQNVSARKYLPYINDIARKAVLLESSTMGGRTKSENSLLMHTLYAVANAGDGPELLKLYVEEMRDPNSTDTAKRAYQLQNIEKAPAAGGGVQDENAPISLAPAASAGRRPGVIGSGSLPSLIRQTADIQTVADLFAAVKAHDPNFHPKPASKIINEDGTPRVVYHQTAADFWTFSTDNPAAGASDSETPNGIFFKDNDHDIGIGGSRQMGVYLAIMNPLRFANRAQANRWYCNNVSGYRALQDEMKKTLKPFNDRLEDIENRMFADETDDEAYEALDREWNGVLEEMRAVETDYRTRLRELLNDYFLKSNSGYDGITLDYDGHRYIDGKREDVKTYIAFKNTQAKSATDNVGTFDRANPDIRFSVDSGDGGVYNALMERDDVLLGDTDDTFTEGNRSVEFVYAVVPGDSLIVSNDEYGGVNPDYPRELQPRDRTRASSRMQLQDMSRSLNPRMLAESPTAQNGAPIVRGDGVVIGGNGRSRAILTAYANGNADAYEAFLREQGGRYGIDTSALPDKPVLVRIARNVEDWPALARELNVSSTAGYSATEQAMSDAGKMDGVLELLQPNDEGDINTADNRAFIQAFIQSVVPENERGEALDGPGRLSRRGLERAENAIFAYAYGDPELMARYGESLDNDMKNVTNALMQTAPAAVALRADIAAGRAYDVPAIQTVRKGLEIYSEARRRNETVAEHLAQSDLFAEHDAEAEWFAGLFEMLKRSAKQLRAFLGGMDDEITEYGDPRQGSLFGGEKHDIREALEGAIRRYERESGRELPRPDYGRDRGIQEDTAGHGGTLEAEADAAGNSYGEISAENDTADGGGLPESASGELSLPTLEPEVSENGRKMPEPEGQRLPTPEPEDFQETVRRQVTGEEPAAESAGNTPEAAPKRQEPERKPPRVRPPEHRESTLPESGIPEGYDSIEEFVASRQARAEAEREQRLRGAFAGLETQLADRVAKGNKPLTVS